MDKHCLDANFVSEPQFLRALNSRWARKLKRLHVFRLSFPGMMIQGIAIFNSFWLGKNSVSNCRNCWVLSVSITGEALRQGLNFRAINWNSTVSLAIVPHHSPSSCSKRRISYLCHSISKENKIQYIYIDQSTMLSSGMFWDIPLSLIFSWFTHSPFFLICRHAIESAGVNTRRSVQDGKVGCNTSQFTKAFQYSDWLFL